MFDGTQGSDVGMGYRGGLHGLDRGMGYKGGCMDSFEMALTWASLNQM